MCGVLQEYVERIPDLLESVRGNQEWAEGSRIGTQVARERLELRTHLVRSAAEWSARRGQAAIGLSHGAGVAI